MTYYNENDGLHYTDAAFTTLATGVIDGLCYQDGSLVYGIYENKPYWNGSGSNLDYADFSYQDLSTVDFSDVRSVVGANFWGSTLNNIGIGHNSETGPQSTVPAYLLEGANFAYGVIKNCAIANNTTGTSYVGVRFENCSISGDFSNTYMEDCSFISCQIYQADFSGGVFVNATFQSSQISDTNFFGANLGSVYFLSNVFSGSTDFTGASYEGYQGPQINTDGVVSYEDLGNGLPGNAGLNSTIGFAYTGTDYNSYVYWINGEITTLEGGGMGDWNGSHYRYGEIFTEGYDDNNSVYYVGGQATSLDYAGSGFWSDKAYFNGSEQPTGYNAYFYYINNVETTLDIDGNGTWNGQTYVNGVVQGGGGGGSVNLESGLQAFYKLSDTSDSSGNNRTLTNNGNVSFASGKIGNAAVFDGSNYLSHSQKFMSGASAFSFACFVKCTSSTTYIYGEDADADFILVSTHDDKATFNFENGWNPIQSSSTITDDQWHHVVCVYDGGVSAKLYFDGVEEASRNSVAVTMPTSSAANFSLGAPPTGWGAMLNGSIDAVGIWNRALSDAEVAALYNNGTGLEVGQSSNLPPNYKGEWDNFTYYTQDDVVSVSGQYWILSGLGGWTVGGAPALGYGWTRYGVSLVRISGGSKFFGRVKFAV